MSKETKKGMVPKLRFPEFREAGEWEEKRLGDMGKFTGGGTPSKDNDSYWKGSIPWISSSDIHEDSIHQIKISRFITNEAIKDSATKMVPGNSILLVSRVGVGKLAISRHPLTTSQDFTNFTPSTDNVTFLAYYLKANSNMLLQFSQGMAIKGFTKEDVSRLNLLLPTPKEQQKIAACLSSLDDLIAAQSRKVEALKTHKKGLMQQLFPAEGETAPRVRFAEFREAGEWEERKLANCISLISGLHLFPEEYSNAGGIPYFAGPSDFTNSKVDVKKWTSKMSNTAEADDTLITVKGSGVGELWHLTIVKVAIGRQLMAVRACGCNSRFLFYFLGLKKKLFEALGSGNLIPGLSRNDILDIEVKIPNLKEQQKIATCLSSLDDLIAAQSQKLETLKTHKKGLMQQLFPNPNDEAI